MPLLLRVLCIFIFTIFQSGCAVFDKRQIDWDTDEYASTGSNVDLHFEEMGDGKPVILLHGFAASTFTWRHLAPVLAETNKVYLLDLKGFGGSPKPDDSAYTIFDQAHLVLKFIEKHQLTNFSIIGHSYGGGVSLVTALLLNKNSPGTLNKLVLIGSIAYSQEIPFFIELLATPFLGGLVANTVPVTFQVRNVLDKAYYNDDLITEEVVQAYSVPLGEDSAVNALLSTAKSIIPSNIEELSLEYPLIKVPTKLIWGKQDEIVPLEVGKKLNQSISDSSLLVIEDCGHIPQEECPDLAVPPIIDFLTKD